MTIIYNRASLSEFTSWHNTIKQQLDYPKTGYNLATGEPVIDIEVENYFELMVNPEDETDVIWIVGNYPSESFTQYTKAEGDAILNTWFGWT